MISRTILELLGSALAIVRAFTDPESKTKSFNLAIRKNTREALNISEEIQELVDEYIKNMPPQFQRKYRRLKKRFNKKD